MTRSDASRVGHRQGVECQFRQHSSWKDVQKGPFSPAAQPGSSGIPPAERHGPLTSAATTRGTAAQTELRWEHTAAPLCPAPMAAPDGSRSRNVGCGVSERVRERLLESHPAFPGTGPAGRQDAGFGGFPALLLPI